MKKMSINFGKLQLDKIDWYTFKSLVLCHGKDLKEVCTDLGLKSNPKLRENCFKQLQSGEGMKLYFAQLQGGAEAAEDEEEDEE